MTIDRAQRALKKYFGYDSFRPMQTDIIETVFAKRDALVLMPTGGGKSICFQIPAICTEGVAVVVSPLIALMKDQVEGLLANGIPAAFLNSSQNAYQQQDVENQLFGGRLKLLYVSPEKLLSAGFASMLKNLYISVFAIDEAHCISSWGHDFRPEYTQMGFLAQQFPHVPIIALTATADRLTRQDIIEKLNLRNPAIFISSFDRPNLSLEVRPAQKRIEQIVDFLRRHPRQAGIIYCLSRKTTEDIASKLREKGFSAEPYHALLPPTLRSKVQDEFLSDRLQIVCATIAFGMGIDKPNVRWVIHYNLPKNIESYYQEIGRAGRDGAASETILFYSISDVIVYRDMFEQNESVNKEIQLAKLERMLQFADASICRRKILLNYFNEYLSDNCGNCDVCKNPPQYFDGSQLAQMALSAVTRLKQNVNMTILVDVLRGSARQDIIMAGYDKIKTYGVGRAYSPSDWQSYIWQLIQLGYLEIAYEDYHKLRLTSKSHDVLFNGQKVQLFRPISIQQRKADAERETTERLRRESAEPRLRARNALFDALRSLRSELALAQGVPPYIVFGDVSLEEMAAQMPINEEEILRISGVGERKMTSFGNAFLDCIRKFLDENPEFAAQKSEMLRNTPPSVSPPKTSREPIVKEKKVNTLYQTFELHEKGHSIDEIAALRSITRGTVIAHLQSLYEQDENINFNEIIAPHEIAQISEAIPLFGEEVRLRDLFDHFNNQISYDKLRFALTFYNKNK